MRTRVSIPPAGSVSLVAKNATGPSGRLAGPKTALLAAEAVAQTTQEPGASVGRWDNSLWGPAEGRTELG
jgi:hypothetical protein